MRQSFFIYLFLISVNVLFSQERNGVVLQRFYYQNTTDTIFEKFSDTTLFKELNGVIESKNDVVLIDTIKGKQIVYDAFIMFTLNKKKLLKRAKRLNLDQVKIIVAYFFPPRFFLIDADSEPEKYREINFYGKIYLYSVVYDVESGSKIHKDQTVFKSNPYLKSIDTYRFVYFKNYLGFIKSIKNDFNAFVLKDIN